MYQILKKITKRVLPKKLLSNNEIFFRRILSLKYKGDSYECNICGFKMKQFIILPDQDKMCPYCGSLPRNRCLFDLLKRELFNGVRILHFSPSKSLNRKLKQNNEIEYITSDFAGEFSADKKYNLVKIDEENAVYDVIICYHILEHIEEDVLAMKELKRILKPGGKCFIQTPYKVGEIYENNEITLPGERTKHFGQHDHVRIYSLSGLVQRLTEAGFETQVYNCEERGSNPYGFKSDEHVIIAS